MPDVQIAADFAQQVDIPLDNLALRLAVRADYEAILARIQQKRAHEVVRKDRLAVVAEHLGHPAEACAVGRLFVAEGFARGSRLR